MSLTIPPNNTPDREAAILDYVQQGAFEAPYAAITSTYNGHTATFNVFADALKIEGVRVNMTAQTQQKVADLLDCMLLTPKLADLIWVQRQVSLPPFPLGASPDMGSTAMMIKHSSKIDDALAKLPDQSGLICTVGKHWVVDNDLLIASKSAMNYGWHFEGQTFQGSGFEATASHLQTDHGFLARLIQGKGTRHNMYHVDYSQTCVLVSLDCTVDGQSARLTDVLKDPTLFGLANMGGILHVLRQPGT